MTPRIVEGDLLEQRVDAIVNAWNRNIIPWWLLLPQGVSGAIKKRGGLEPFRELARVGPMPLGTAVVTSAGRLPHRGIIHVAGINMLWRSSERAIRDSVTNALARAREHGFGSVAFPIIGAGSGGFDEDRALGVMRSTLEARDVEVDVTVVRYRRR
ncbi:MAG TPA: macro domain-containing protein [Archangium sp.]|uniref:macro domain-containing protein n=1 Tax=Archangium sp. TaxID=1872627 RepID=UPI002E32B765|nr:macro domain-containing protein [Archangium sp.]HEX5753134.1 macro domain-containing protein [Archangium sp.]